MAKINGTTIFGKSQVKYFLKIQKYIEYRENFRGLSLEDFYGCDQVFHVGQNIATLGIPGNSLQT